MLFFFLLSQPCALSLSTLLRFIHEPLDRLTATFEDPSPSPPLVEEIVVKGRTKMSILYFGRYIPISSM
ncbi:hypothetical protein I3842_15G031200 [Carya illinoinensis]|uniref:Secreted protein n=1 Tax=Carya illinoinensis TaxID=32201 RepID=A0A922A5G2_CARIL|nr:hypothetical protein I3842_15G031200 [Carya illinoinensis]